MLTLFLASSARYGIPAAMLCACLFPTPAALAQKPSAPPALTVKTCTPGTPPCTAASQGQTASLTAPDIRLSVSLYRMPDELQIRFTLDNPRESRTYLAIEPNRIHTFKNTSDGLRELPLLTESQLASAFDTSIGGEPLSVTPPPPLGPGQDDSLRRVKQHSDRQQSILDTNARSLTQAQLEAKQAFTGSLVSTSLAPGGHVTGVLHYGKRKPGEDLTVQVAIGNTRYDFPLHLPKP